MAPQAHSQQDLPLESVARPKQARSEATLQRILEAAEVLLAEKRFAAISIPEIAMRARSLVGGFYGRFKDKDALLRALEERFFRRLSDRADRVADPKVWARVDVQDLIRGLVHELISAAEDERNLTCAILTRAPTDPEPQHETEQFRRDVGRPFHLMGTSIGANLAWWLAAKHSDRIATLICINIPHPGALAEGRSKTKTIAEGQNAKLSYIREAAKEGNERTMFEAMLAK